MKNKGTILTLFLSIALIAYSVLIIGWFKDNPNILVWVSSILCMLGGVVLLVSAFIEFDGGNKDEK